MEKTNTSRRTKSEAVDGFEGREIGLQLGGPKLSDRVAVDLQVRILEGAFEPGQPLPPEAKLCDAYGVSRSVIRDAIRTLSARGLVDVHQGRGTAISEPSEAAVGFAMLAMVMRSDTTMGDILEMRAVVEGQFLPIATQNRTQADLDRARERYELFEQAVKSENWDSAHEQHLEFHLELIKAIGVQVMPLFLRPLHEIINLSSLPPLGADPSLWELEAHKAILDALEERDAGAMARAVEQHFDFMRREPYLTWRRTRFRDAVSEDALRAAVLRASE